MIPNYILRDVCKIIPISHISLLHPMYDTIIKNRRYQLKMMNCLMHNADKDFNSSSELSGVAIPYGNVNARVMIVDTFPSENDTKTTVPFLSAKGLIVSAIIKLLGHCREDVYSTTIFKNLQYQKLTREQQIKQSYYEVSHYLLREISLVRPDVIILMGELAVHTVRDYAGFCDTKQRLPISMLRNLNDYLIFKDYKSKLIYTYSPQVFTDNNLLPNEIKNYKDALWNDISKAFSM